MSIRDLSLAPGQFEGLVADIRRMGYTREEAEDALSDAWITVAGKADQLEDGPIGGYLKGTARFKALKARERRQRQGIVSLDAIVDGDREHKGRGDSLEALADQNAMVGEEDLQLAELEADPYGRRVLNAARQGVSPRIAPRGANHQCAKYTDQQVQHVRELRKAGHTYVDIEVLTGVPHSYGYALVKRHSRASVTTEGWSHAMVVDAIKRYYARHGKVPRNRDSNRNHSLPSQGTAVKLYGSWNKALLAAGLTPTYDRPIIWSTEEIVRALCAWYHREQRIPTCKEWRSQMPGEMPSHPTLQRRFGTSSPRVILETAREQCQQLGCTHATAKGGNND
ncbi:MAG TPA: hypothetical protein VK730_13735 [Solirubrobacteraceae bacterium]|jgi:hypothetical protein|nr:hypothetical protein [Solirubrobacteraceae bacterium]